MKQNTPVMLFSSLLLFGVICIENALKGTEIVFVLTGNSY